jgi:uncharacterized protein YjbI with pentapeptide repeats
LQAASSCLTPISSETAEIVVLQDAHAEVREAVVASELLVRIDFGAVDLGCVDLGGVDLGGVDFGGVGLGGFDFDGIEFDGVPGVDDCDGFDFVCLDFGDVDLGDVALRKSGFSNVLVVPWHTVVAILVPFAAVVGRSRGGALFARQCHCLRRPR